MPLKCSYTRDIVFDIYLWLHKVLLFKRWDILSHSALKKSYFTQQKHDSIWKMSLTHKN